jgi:transcriptional regulator with XRE-family HTH domain
MKIMSRGAALAQIIEEFCRSKGISVRQFALGAGIQSSTISAWKKGRAMPETSSIEAVALNMNIEFEVLWAQINQLAQQDSVSRIVDSLEQMPAEDLIRLIEKASGVLASKFVAA